MELNNRQIYNAIYGDQKYNDNNFIGQFNNALDGLKTLDDLYISDAAIRQKFKSALNNTAYTAAVGGASTLASGLTSIFGNVDSITSTQDASQQHRMINDIKNVGTNDYTSYTNVFDDYNKLSTLNPDLSYGAIRGGSTGQRIANIGSSTLSGALAGLQLGGPVGAAVGGAVGLGASIGGLAYGNSLAKAQQGLLQNKLDYANKVAHLNITGNIDRLANRQFRQNYSNRADYGGYIERRQLDLSEFSDKALKRQRNANRTHSAFLVRRFVDGGTLIRIKK